VIKNKKRNIYLGIKLSVLLILLFSLVKTYLYFSEKNKVLIYCNFEKHKTDGDTIIYKTNNIFLKLKIATKNSSEFALSGENSLKINNEEFTNLIELKNIGPDEVYKVTIYRKSGTAGIVIQEATAKQTKVYKFQKFASETTSDGWEKLETQLRTPPNYNENNLKVYLWNPKKDICYFDDLSIEQIEYMEYPIYDSLSSINIFIEDLQFNKLKKNRKKAFEKGILVTDKDSYVNAIVAYEDNLFEGVLRFKGDWLDHLAGDKWSFRVKLEDGSWRNICTFSLQTPASRSYINEWFIHMVFLDNDILTTRYDFIPVNLNGRSLGIYAFEEHFQKQLLEGNLRREAPIVSFSEEILWNRRSIELNSNEDFIFASSVIEPFQQKRVFKDSGLHDKFIIAQNLLGSYKNGELKASEVFDIKQTAKFFAIQTVFGGYHGVVWHNIRFYYNPVTCLIEPIAFDCFSNWGIYNWGFTDIICNFSADKTHILPNYSSFYIDLITDSKFVKEYISQ